MCKARKRKIYQSVHISLFVMSTFIIRFRKTSYVAGENTPRGGDPSRLPNPRFISWEVHLNHNQQSSTKVYSEGLSTQPIWNHGSHFWQIILFIFCCKLYFVLFHVKSLPAKNGGKTNVAITLKYMTANCWVPLKVAARKKKKLLVKLNWLPKFAASQQ